MGSSCFPLSPAKGSKSTECQSIELNDQLKVIVDSLGKSDELDKTFLVNPKAREYFQVLNEGAVYK